MPAEEPEQMHRRFDADRRPRHADVQEELRALDADLARAEPRNLPIQHIATGVKSE
jgi:hypothetical protein